ncbi:hypothetical protein P9112_008550 [Eukaryota sp. TZLM1-RC]
MVTLVAVALVQPGLSSSAWENVLSFVPNNLPDHLKDNLVRLSLGVTPFMDTFTDDPINSISCNNHQLVFHKKNEYLLSALLSTSTTEYHHSFNHILSSLLCQTLDLLLFTNSPLSSSSTSLLHNLTTSFITPNLASPLALFPAYRSAPLSPQLMLTTASMLSRINSTFNFCTSCLFYSDRLVFSTLNPTDTFLISLYVSFCVEFGNSSSESFSVIPVSAPVFVNNCSCDQSNHGIILIKSGFLTVCFLSTDCDLEKLSELGKSVLDSFSSNLSVISKANVLIDPEKKAFSYLRYNTHRQTIFGGHLPFSSKCCSAIVCVKREFDKLKENKVVYKRISSSEWLFCEKTQFSELFLVVPTSSSSLSEVENIVNGIRSA